MNEALSEAVLDDLNTSADHPIYSGAGTVSDKLDRARTELLDLSARNRLLNMPKSGKSSKTIELVDERSSEVFRLLVAGHRVEEIAPILSLSTKTVANYQSSIRQKLDVSNAAQVVRLAMNQGLLSNEPGHDDIGNNDSRPG